MRAVDEEEPAQDTDDSEAYPLQVHVHCLDDSQLVTLQLQAGSYVRFQVGMGAECNVLPLGTYQEATGDMSLSNVCTVQTKVTAYGGGTLPVVGSVKMKVWRGKKKYHIKLTPTRSGHSWDGKNGCSYILGQRLAPQAGHRRCTSVCGDQYRPPLSGTTKSKPPRRLWGRCGTSWGEVLYCTGQRHTSSARPSTPGTCSSAWSSQRHLGWPGTTWYNNTS